MAGFFSAPPPPPPPDLSETKAGQLKAKAL